MVYAELFYVFMLVGFTSFGGMSMVPLINAQMIGHGWMTATEVLDIVAIAEMTPGSLGFNCATFAGMRVAGVLGAVVATLGLVTPSIIVIMIIAGFLKAFRTNRFVDAAFYGLRPASTAMVASAGISVVLLSLLDTSAAGLAIFRWKELALAAVILVLTRWVPATKKLHPIVFIAAAAVVGVIFHF